MQEIEVQESENVPFSERQSGGFVIRDKAANAGGELLQDVLRIVRDMRYEISEYTAQKATTPSAFFPHTESLTLVCTDGSKRVIRIKVETQS